MLGNLSIRTTEQIFNVLQLLGIFLTLFLAFAFQIILHELPCPLCLLQRLGFLGVAFGFLLNLRFGLRPSHYALSLLSALFTSFVALRQIALHIVPGTGFYGNAILGLHLYSWSFIIAILIVIVTILMLAVDAQYLGHIANKKPMPKFAKLLFAIMALLLVANIISVLLECGIGQCPDNPIRYYGIP